MIIFNCRFTTIGGTTNDYKIREGDIEKSLRPHGSHLEIADLFSSLEGIYNISEEVGSLPEIMKIEITQEDVDPDVLATFNQLRPYLNYESLEDERKIFGLLEAMGVRTRYQ